MQKVTSGSKRECLQNYPYCRTPNGIAQSGWVRWMSIAASVLIVASITWYLWQAKQKPAIVAEHQTPVATVIPAGGNKATLTVADGTVIDLDKAGNGTIATEGKTTVNKKKTDNWNINRQLVQSSRQLRIIC